MLAILTLLLLFTSTEPRIVTCTVVVPNRVISCPEGEGDAYWHVKGTPGAVSIWDEWKLVAPMQDGRANPDARLRRTIIVKGQKVKAQVDGSQLIPVAECNVRVWRRAKAWRANGHEGEIPPNMLFTQPDDCQPWYGSKAAP